MPFLEAALVEELKRNNEQALRQLYQQNYHMVLRLVVSNNGSEQEAKDVYQEAIIHVYERLSQPGFALTCKISTFIYAICRNRWLQKLAKQNRHVRMSAIESLPDTAAEVEDMEKKESDFRLMDASLGKLGEPCRSLLEDFYLRDLTMEALTEKFGYTNADNAKTQKYKCLQRLKRYFFETKS